MAKKPVDLKMLSRAVTAAVLILSAGVLTLTGYFIWGALIRGTATPTGTTAGRTETVNAALFDKTIEAFDKKTAAQPLSGDIKNPFASKAVPPPAPTPAPAK